MSKLHRDAAANTRRFAGPAKPARAERNVLEAVASGWRESPEAILKRGLERRNLRYTNERRGILQAVMSAHEHFDADWLYLQMRTGGAKVSRATIYRNLGLFCELGLLREVFRGPRGSSYEHVYGHEHHEHMICLVCGKILEFSSRQLESIQEQACRELKFSPVHHHLQILGYCEKCAPRR
jgi:Fur family ferric uptake transcriptional regulator